MNTRQKEILRSYGVSVPNGRVAFTVDEAVEAAKELGAPVCVVKAQIHAGGRGKAGGVKVAKSSRKSVHTPVNCSAKCSSPIKPARKEKK
ncbi:Succinyl-CoA ligase [ADP-forming] subunit beta [Geobacillus sp. BCO2]|nr:Succinyl-CoA ligase [ADP-forming] subunit beta [Geobacillus sp. BCO2]